MPSPIDRGEVARRAGLCLAASMLEYAIPKPLPFLKLGLANLPLLAVAGAWDLRAYLLLVLCKTIGSALVGGTLFSPLFLMLFAGGMASALAMAGARKLGASHITSIGVSVVGALTNNLVQLWVAAKLVYGPSVRVMLPLVLGIGLVGGTILGVLDDRFRATFATVPEAEAEPMRTAKGCAPLCLLLLVTLCCYGLRQDLSRLAAVWVLLLLLQACSGRRIRPSYLVALFAGLLALSLLTPSGLVLWERGPLSITSGALQDALAKGLRLSGMIAISQALVTVTPILPNAFFRTLAEAVSFAGSLKAERRNGVLVFVAQEPRTRRPPRIIPMALLASLAIVLLLP